MGRFFGIAAAAAALLASVALAGGDRVRRAPDIEGKKRTEAERILRRHGLRWKPRAPSARLEPPAGADPRAKRVPVVHERLVPDRRVTNQDPAPGGDVEPGDEVWFGTSPLPPGRGKFTYPDHLTGDRVRGRRIVLVTKRIGCTPLDHVDVAPRRRWLIATPFFTSTNSYSDSCRNRRRSITFELDRRVGRKPVIEGPPARPRRRLHRVEGGGWDRVRLTGRGRWAAVYFTTGACSRYAGARFRRRGRAAELTILRGDPHRGEGLCILIAYRELTLVRIPDDLVGRPIVRPRRR